VALVCEGEHVTYGELEGRANQLRHHLAAMGKWEKKCGWGLCVERSVEMVVGMLGILKAGGAYVPLDAGYPAERLSYMMEEGRVGGGGSDVGGVKGTTLCEWKSGVGGEPGTQEWKTDRKAKQGESKGKEGAEEAGLAYVMYTSGSTGKAKGTGSKSTGASCAW